MSEGHQYNEKGSNTYQSKKSRSVTFRLDSKVIDELQTEANTKEVSLNVLVNQVLKRYAEWDRYENKIGMMPVPRMILSLYLWRRAAELKTLTITEMIS
jgi:hypothetical protein